MFLSAFGKLPRFAIFSVVRVDSSSALKISKTQMLLEEATDKCSSTFAFQLECRPSEMERHLLCASAEPNRFFRFVALNVFSILNQLLVDDLQLSGMVSE